MGSTAQFITADHINRPDTNQSVLGIPFVIDDRFGESIPNVEVEYVIRDTTMLRVYDLQGNPFSYEAIFGGDSRSPGFFVSVMNNTSSRKRYTLLLIHGDQIQPFMVDSELEPMESFSFELEQHHLLHIPIRIPNLTAKNAFGDNGILRILLFHIPEDPGRTHIPYFSQGLQIVSDRQNEPGGVNYIYDLRVFRDIPTTDVVVHERQHEILFDGSPIPDILVLEPGKKYQFYLRMRPGNGLFLTMVLINGRPIKLFDTETVLWEGRNDQTYLAEFELVTPLEPGDYPFFALTVNQNDLKTGMVNHVTSPLYTVRIEGTE